MFFLSVSRFVAIVLRPMFVLASSCQIGSKASFDSQGFSIKEVGNHDKSLSHRQVFTPLAYEVVAIAEEGATRGMTTGRVKHVDTVA